MLGPNLTMILMVIGGVCLTCALDCKFDHNHPVSSLVNFTVVWMAGAVGFFVAIPLAFYLTRKDH